MKVPAALACAAALALTTGCGGSDRPDDGRPVVAAAFYPYAFVVEQVGGSHVRVENLTSPGVEPHDLELRPRQVATIQEADLVVFQSGFQPAVDDAIDVAGRAAETFIDAADLADLDVEDHHDDAAQGEDHEHEHEGSDPHLWLDPTRLADVADMVAQWLADADPDHARTYQANAADLIERLEQLDAAFTEGLATCERDTIVTSHAAFGYLAARYDLHQLSIAGLDPTSEPSGRQLAQITDQVKAHGITTVFTEELVDPANARTIAGATGVQVATLDPIEGLGPDTADEDYLTLMERNLQALRAANGCR